MASAVPTAHPYRGDTLQKRIIRAAQEGHTTPRSAGSLRAVVIVGVAAGSADGRWQGSRPPAALTRQALALRHRAENIRETCAARTFLAAQGHVGGYL